MTPSLSSSASLRINSRSFSCCFLLAVFQLAYILIRMKDTNLIKLRLKKSHIKNKLQNLGNKAF